MSVGSLARRILGPLADPVARAYRGYFIDLDWFARSLEVLEPVESVLEIGCGEGHLCEELASVFPSASILGIDVADNPGRGYTSRRERVEFRQVNADDLPRSVTYDLVVLSDVLHHVANSDRRRLVDTAWSLTSTRGHMVVKDWVATSNLATQLAYLSDRFVTNDRPSFFKGRGDLVDVVTGDHEDRLVVAEGFVPPHDNNVYLVVAHTGNPPGG